jgi:beta-glucosidase
MPAFIDIAGVPMTANAPLLRGWLRGLRAFDGVLISDYNAIAELCNHGVASDVAHAAALALTAGVDIDMASEAYVRGLPEALRRGLIGMAELDASVSRVLALKERLGLFDDPYRRGSAAAEAAGRTTAAARQLAREAARSAIVLLTHRRHVLPITAQARHIAVIGPLASARGEMLGPWAWAGRAEETVSILDGLRTALPHCRIESFAAGASGDISGAVAGCRTAELTLLCLGENVSMSGEGGSRVELGLPDGQRALAEAVLEVGKRVVALLTSGRPLTVPWLFERADAVLATWFLGSEAGHAIADVLTGAFNPTGKLAVTWPRHIGQVPIFYGQRPTGRPTRPGERLSSAYLDIEATPQFAFGHGLSYAAFTVEGLRCTPRTLKAADSIEVSVSVRNHSATAGEATLFLFVRDVVASIARPVLELKGVRRIALAPAERGTLTWVLPAAALAFVGADLGLVLEPGRFEIHVGQSAAPGELLSCSIEVIS